MYSLVIDAHRKEARLALVYLIISVFAAAFGAIYELYSYEVYSFFMLYAFGFPLVGGALPYMIASRSRKDDCYHEATACFGHCGIATLTVGSFVCGALEIYGISNRLTDVYWIVGSALLMIATLKWVLQMICRKKRS